MRHTRSLLAVLLAAAPMSALAQAPAAPPAPAAQAEPAGDPVVARVDGHEIHMSDMKVLAQGLPAQLRGVPMPMLYPMLLNQAVDREALTLKARKDGLDKDADVQRAIQRAGDDVLSNALLSREIGPAISEEAIRARYDRDYKDKPGAPEVHARHILVASEADAQKVMKELKGGAKFEDLAKKYSTDPGAQDGGDLGWFKRDDMVPEFANAAFALKPGEVTQAPVHTQFGWHVIKSEGKRTAPPETYDNARETIRQALIAENVKKAVAEARSGLTIAEYTPEGTPMPDKPAATPAPEGAAPAAPVPAVPPSPAAK